MDGKVALSSPIPPAPSDKTRHARFEKEKASHQTLSVANWVVDSADNQGMLFMVIDKAQESEMFFDASSQLQGATPAPLGLERGDDAAPGIGQRMKY